MSSAIEMEPNAGARLTPTLHHALPSRTRFASSSATKRRNSNNDEKTGIGCGIVFLFADEK
jgi:hypothetical protein